MGRTISFRYSVEVTTNTGGHTPAGWPTRNRAGSRVPSALLGKPNAAKLAQWVADFNASLLPGGCNAHIGTGGTITSARIIDHDNNRAIVATFNA
jgi:hypothetical protein